MTTISRRTFLKTSGALGAGAVLGVVVQIVAISRPSLTATMFATSTSPQS